MHFPLLLQRGTLVARYKRFFADVLLDGGQAITAHCANPGAMLGLKEPGLPVWVSPSASTTRKLAWNLELVELPSGLVGVNTAHPNRIVAEAIANGAIPELAAYSACRAEVKYGERSRIDFLLTCNGLPDLYLEVKNVHFSRTLGLAEFPDSPTDRGARHLAELSAMVAAGHRAVMLYLVQRSDCEHFTFSADLDPKYAAGFALAKTAGVEALCYDCEVTTQAIALRRALPIAVTTDYV
jgi:sugar fermentation stimulation protein A